MFLLSVKLVQFKSQQCGSRGRKSGLGLSLESSIVTKMVPSNSLVGFFGNMIVILFNFLSATIKYSIENQIEVHIIWNL